MSGAIEERERREADAYADDAMTQANAAWQQRFHHIPAGPTTTRAFETAFSLITDGLSDTGRVLDVGCGRGIYTHRIKQLGASYVLGSDISEYYVAEARYTRMLWMGLRTKAAYLPG